MKSIIDSHLHISDPEDKNLTCIQVPHELLVEHNGDVTYTHTLSFKWILGLDRLW